MTRQIFVNLPVKDIARSMQFFKQLGFDFNMRFTDDKAACLVIGENIYAMLLKEEFFKSFTKKEIADASKVTEVLIAIDVESKAAVDSLVQKAVSAGGTIYAEPADHGWMYQHSFADLDGHQWEIFYSDINALNNK